MAASVARGAQLSSSAPVAPQADGACAARSAGAKLADMRKTAAVALTFAAAVVPCVAASQPALEPADVDDTQARIVAAILGEEAKNGPYSLDLIAPLTELSLVYEDLGRYDLAAAVNDRARQAMRANYGLYTLAQAPLLQQEMHNADERGDAVTAWNLEHDLLDLVDRHPEDLRTTPILRELGDRRVDL